MAVRPSNRPQQYQDKHNPSFHKGTVSVIGSTTVNLGLGHNNYEVWHPKLPGQELFDVKITKLTGRNLGKFTLQVQEIPARMVVGGRVQAPTNPSTQATGAGGITVLRVNISEYIAKLAGSAGEAAAAADVSIHSGSVYPGLIATFSAVVAAVLKNVAGVLSIVFVKGTAALDGAEVAPTDAQIQADGGVGAGVPWVRLCNIRVRRLVDTTLTITYDNTVRYTAKDSQSAVDVSFFALAGASQE